MLFPEAIDCQIKNPVPDVGYLASSCLVMAFPKTTETVQAAGMVMVAYQNSMVRPYC